MADQPGSDSVLSPEIKAAVWRIFGAGAKPGTRRSTFNQIEPVIREHVPPADQDRAIAHIGSWFEPGAHLRWLKPELTRRVAGLVLDGVGSGRTEAAVWAIGSFAPELSVEMLRRRWSSEEIGSFIDAAIDALNGVADRARERHRAPGAGEDAADGGFGEAARREGLVGAFAGLERRSVELVNQGLHPTVDVLIELVVGLDPTRFATLVESLEEPAMQAKAARRMFVRSSSAQRTASLDWITSSSGEAVVALAIVHTLNHFRRMEEGRAPLEGQASDERTEEVQPPDDRDSAPATRLLSGLVERLRRLDPPACLRWTGELLSHAPQALVAVGVSEKPPRLAQLEAECARVAAEVFFESRSADLLLHFQSGLRPTCRRSRVRRHAAVAWAMRELSLERAAELARATLKEHGRQLAEQREGHHLPSDWSDWKDREWLEGLGAALALSREELDLPDWVRAQCRDLPLDVWDAEEDMDAFSVAGQAAQHWFLVALLAVPRRAELGRRIEPAAVLRLAEALWAHCRFCRQMLDIHPEASVPSELAARYSLEFGEADDEWILEQSRREEIGPRVLWALLEERRKRSRPAVEGSPDYDQMIVIELVRVASMRFEDHGQFDLEALEFWGRLWLLLEAVNQAERTAVAIASFPLRTADRHYRIMALKLLGLVIRKRKLLPGIGRYVAPLYHQLWPAYDATPSEEREDRREIDGAFAGSDLLGI